MILSLLMTIALSGPPVLVIWEGRVPSHCEPIRTRFLHRHVSVRGASGNAGDVAGTLAAAVVAMQEAAAAVGADTVRVTWSEERRVPGREPVEHRVKGKAWRCEP